MQYILSKEEYDALVKQAHEKDHIKLTRDELQALCTEISDTMPVNWGWGGPDPKPWGCIHSEKDEWYCDSCPVQKICPSNKNWSK